MQNMKTNRKLPWETQTSDKTQWELEIEHPDQDHVKAHGLSNLAKSRTTLDLNQKTTGARTRRLSHDPVGKSKSFIVDVEKTKRELLAQEDTDNNYQITIQDKGPKIFNLGTFDSEGFKTLEVRGVYRLSNLLQELAIASEYGRRTIVLDEERLNENPVERLTRLIKYHFWDSLTRRMDAKGLETICADPKNRSLDQRNRVYVPFGDNFAYEYYRGVAETKPHLALVVERLPEFITPEYVRSINKSPGISF